MSGAFTREPEGPMAGEADMDLPQSEHPNYITRRGLDGLHGRLEALREERRQHAGGEDDINDSLHVAQLDREIRYVQTRIDRAIPVDTARVDHESVGFGARVTVVDDDGHERHIHIVGEDEADVAHDTVSWVSPLARALRGAEVGDTITWQRPAGAVTLTVRAIAYPSDNEAR